MIEQVKSSKSNDDLKEAPAYSFDLLTYDSHRGLRFVLQQIADFHDICDVFGLPTDNPFAFFHRVKEQFAKGTFQTAEHTITPMEYKHHYMGLFLLYACYGDALFCSAYALDNDFPAQIQELVCCPDRQELLHKIHKYGLAQPLRDILSSNKQQRVFSLYPELIQLEEMNTKRTALALQLYGTQSLTDVCISCNQEFTEQLFELFLAYYKSRENIAADDIQPKNGKKVLPSIVMQRKSLQFIFLLRDLARRFQDESQDSLTAALIRQYTTELIQLLKNYSTLAIKKPLKTLYELYQCKDNKYAVDYISTRGKSLKAQIANLFCLMDGVESTKQLNKLAETLTKLLNAYQDEIYYKFFSEIALRLYHTPQLQRLAPVYVWRIFHQHCKSLFEMSSYLFDSPKAVDFSVAPLFDLNPKVLSEEKTSSKNARADYELYSNLAELFEKYNPACELDRHMCDHLFQRLILTQMSAVSYTSITNQTLTKPKALFRGFALIYNALEQMGQELWKVMPSERPLSVTAEQAEAFYNDNRRHGAKEIQYLLERSGGLPDSRKKHLSIEQCEKIVQIAFLKRQPATCLSQYLNNYIKSREVLCAFAEKSPENRDTLHFAIFRIALERHAHQLARELLDICAELFYQPLSKAVTSRLWNRLFREHPETHMCKVSTDPIRIGAICFSSRLFYLWNGETSNPPSLEELKKHFSAIVVPHTANTTESYLKQADVSEWPIFQLLSKDIGIDSSHLDRLSIREALSGVILSISILSIVQELQAKDITTLDTNEPKKMAILYENTSKPIREIKAKLKHHDQLLFVHVACHFRANNLDSQVFRVVCRWLAEDGVDAFLLSDRNKPYRMDRGFPVQLPQDIASLPAPAWAIVEPVSDEIANLIIKTTPLFGLVIADSRDNEII